MSAEKKINYCSFFQSNTSLDKLYQTEIPIFSAKRTWHCTLTTPFHLSFNMTRSINKSSIETPKLTNRTNMHNWFKIILSIFYSSKNEIRSELALDYDIHIVSSQVRLSWLHFFFNASTLKNQSASTQCCWQWSLLNTQLTTFNKISSIIAKGRWSRKKMNVHSEDCWWFISEINQVQRTKTTFLSHVVNRDILSKGLMFQFTYSSRVQKSRIPWVHADQSW